MKHTVSLLTALLLTPLAALHAADAPTPSFVKTGVILVNHVGFPPNAAKHCVIPSPPEREFTIHQLKDTVWTHVFAGVLIEGGNELEPGWVGDFSALKEDGIYQVRCGSLRSRAFTVHAGVYDVPMRASSITSPGHAAATRRRTAPGRVISTMAISWASGIAISPGAIISRRTCGSGPGA